MKYIFLFAIACGPKLAAPSAQAGASIADHAAMLEACRAKGLDAGSYAAYEACKDGGHD